MLLLTLCSWGRRGCVLAVNSRVATGKVCVPSLCVMGVLSMPTNVSGMLCSLLFAYVPDLFLAQGLGGLFVSGGKVIKPCINVDCWLSV